jgi:N-acyl-D-amino-acid deacylase
MDGVEDIPSDSPTGRESASNGIASASASTPSSQMQRTIDVGAHVPHLAIRPYVVSNRVVGNQAATAARLVQMAELVRDSLRVGALGFSTMRTLFIAP